MKKITLILITIFMSIGLFSQTPKAFKYQAVVRNDLGEVINNQTVSFRISIHDSIATGPVQYQEVHVVQTDAYGHANLEIGNGTFPTGTLADIDWGDDDKFLEVELDPDGNSAYVSIGTTQLLAVPYSLYAESTGDTTRWRKNIDDLYFLDGKVGIGTSNPQVLLDVKSSSEEIGSSIYLNNSNESHWLQLFGGRGGVSPVYPTLYWQEGDGLRFGTYGTLYTERMRISDMGNVGIGTSIPDEKLSIQGNIMLRDEGYDPYIRLNSDDASDGTTEYIWSEDAKGLAFGDTHGSPQVLIEHVTGNVGIGTDAPEESAKLEVNSNSQGLLPPRMSGAERDAISNPAAGLMVWCNDCGISGELQVYNGLDWVNMIGEPASASIICGETITDIVGNTYNTVQIGLQCWMKENLKTIAYNNSTPIPNVTDGSIWETLTTGAYVWFDNNLGFKDLYGALYNWHAIADANGLCPTGWHVPTSDEWTTLTNFIGGAGSPHGNELKSCRQVNSPFGGDCNTPDHPRWNESSENGTNDYGFSALPGGVCGIDGTFLVPGGVGLWWTSTGVTGSATYRYLDFNLDYINGSNADTRNGYSVRCIKD